MGLQYDPTTGTFTNVGQVNLGEIYIHTGSQFAGVLRSDKVYIVDRFIDMGSQVISPPPGGLTIRGNGYDVSGLYSSVPGHTLFKTPSGSYSGNLTIEQLNIWATGAGSKVFDLDNQNNFGALELNTVNLGSFGTVTPNFGTIKGYRQFRTSTFAFINYTQGLTFDGTMSGLAVNDAICLAVVPGSTALLAGPTLLTTDGLSSNMNALSLGATSTWCNFAPANFATKARMSLTNFRTNATNAVPNLPSTNIKALFRGCTGVKDTFVGASWTMTTAAETNLLVQGTLYKVAGTTAPVLDAHFTHPANNRLQYNGEREIKVDIDGRVELESSGTEVYEAVIYQRDVSAGLWITLRIVPIETATKLLGDRRGDGAIFATADLDTGDYIEVHVRNTNGTGKPTARVQSTLRIRQRQA